MEYANGLIELIRIASEYKILNPSLPRRTS